MVQIGKSSKGKVIHAIIELKGKEFQAACDKRQTGMVPAPANMNVMDITCSKCLQRADVKGALAKVMDADTAEEHKQPEKTKEQAEKTAGLTVVASKKSSKKKQRGGPKEKRESDLLKEYQKKKPDKPTIAATKNDISDKGGDFFARMKADGKYKIYHVPTGKVFFDSIPEEVAIDSICNLNAIPDKWASIEAHMPDDFIVNCRKATCDAFSKNNQTVPNNLKDEKETKKKGKAKKKIAPASKTEALTKGDKMIAVVDGKEVFMEYDGKKFVAVKKKAKKSPEEVAEEVATAADKKEVKAKRVLKRRGKKTEPEKVKRTIKRRDKKEEPKAEEKRVIKRRDKTETLLGRRKGTSGYTVVKAMVEGVQMSEIVSLLNKRHNQSAKRANTIIKGIVRKTTRKQGIPITIVMGENPAEDYYKISTGE